ncbi:4-diphosphocytidyl-2C-methyl-D-erythritol synthase [Actinorhabdospora filicis]|uniref:4-diphosphocytidyl-2C-methyl-D-erythritol synthase n=1 Tax=Actinorhabdospora filicis TaxID=1785913 RepID=A0A9W6SI65_9ACTN|nr:nucleotidyltransferase family protein [Actinorhabdospora filicis]GLZ77560.1 4-diphosphocytidyl-2C-methyl-D-erythritol synthase [Actinorhabdospora filicis]
MRTRETAGLVLAAGAGTRLGRPKAGIVHNGQTLAARACAALSDAGCASVYLVLGADLTVPAPPGCHRVHNPDWPLGIGTSLRVGLEAAGSLDVVVLLADQPWIGPEAVRRLITTEATLATALYTSGPGHPVLIGRDHIAGVAATAQGEVGAREYLRARAGEVARVWCGDVADPWDLDTLADLERLEGAEGW